MVIKQVAKQKQNANLTMFLKLEIYYTTLINVSVTLRQIHLANWVLARTLGSFRNAYPSIGQNKMVTSCPFPLPVVTNMISQLLED